MQAVYFVRHEQQIRPYRLRLFAILGKDTQALHHAT